MTTPDAMRIRPYRADDRPALFDICRLTGDAGGDATGQHRSSTLLGDVYVGPYVEFEPQLAVVLDHDGRPVGYVVGTADTTAFLGRCADEWIPALLDRQPELLAAPRAAMLDVLTRPAVDAEALARHPAHLHIDLLPVAQGGGRGRRLLEAFVDGLRRRGVPGVHLAVDPANDRAIGFYRHLGFTELDGDGVVLGLDLRSTA